VTTSAKLTGLAFWLSLSFAVAAFGSQFEPGVWYSLLNKPSWTPPGWIFPPVWTFLYIAMAVAAWLVWLQRGWRGNRLALVINTSQLVLNAAWSWLFFGQQQIGLAALDIVILFLLLLVVLALFWKQRRAAGLLILPYALWVGFATALNLQIWRMN